MSRSTMGGARKPRHDAAFGQYTRPTRARTSRLARTVAYVAGPALAAGAMWQPAVDLAVDHGIWLTIAALVAFFGISLFADTCRPALDAVRDILEHRRSRRFGHDQHVPQWHVALLWQGSLFIGTSVLSHHEGTWALGDALASAVVLLCSIALAEHELQSRLDHLARRALDALRMRGISVDLCLAIVLAAVRLRARLLAIRTHLAATSLLERCAHRSANLALEASVRARRAVRTVIGRVPDALLTWTAPTLRPVPQLPDHPGVIVVELRSANPAPPRSVTSPALARPPPDPGEERELLHHGAALVACLPG